MKRGGSLLCLKSFVLVLLLVLWLPPLCFSESISELSAPELRERLYELSSQYEILQSSYTRSVERSKLYEQNLKRILEISTEQTQSLLEAQQNLQLSRQDLQTLKSELESTQLALTITVGGMQEVLQELQSLKRDFEILQESYQAILKDFEDLSIEYQALTLRFLAQSLDYEKLSASLKALLPKIEIIEAQLDEADSTILLLQEQIGLLGQEIKLAFWKGFGIGAASGTVGGILIFVIIKYALLGVK
jgi:chromosome segregation ATPase